MRMSVQENSYGCLKKIIGMKYRSSSKRDGGKGHQSNKIYTKWSG